MDISEIVVAISLEDDDSTGGWENFIGHEWAHAYMNHLGSAFTGGLGQPNSSNDNMVIRNSLMEGLSDAWAVILYKARFSGNWEWVIRGPDTPNGYRTILETSGFDSHVNDPNHIHANGEAIAAIFKRMADAGAETETLIKLWTRLVRGVQLSLSPLDDGYGDPAYPNFFDIAQAYIQALESSLLFPPTEQDQKDIACAAWHGTNLELRAIETSTKFHTSPCGPKTPASLPAVEETCVVRYSDGVPSNWTNWRLPLETAVELGKGSYLEFWATTYGGQYQHGVTVDASNDNWGWNVDRISEQYPVFIKARACRRDLTQPDTQICDDFTEPWRIWDECLG